MTTPLEHLDVVVGDDGSVPPVSAAEVARLGARPGEHLRLVRSENSVERRGRKKVRGSLVGKIDPGDLLTDEDFAAAKRERIEIAERRYGSLE
jgi:hypothetical protein